MIGPSQEVVVYYNGRTTKPHNEPPWREAELRCGNPYAAMPHREPWAGDLFVSRS